jgi:hypothetical protein
MADARIGSSVWCEACNAAYTTDQYLIDVKEQISMSFAGPMRQLRTATCPRCVLKLEAAPGPKPAAPSLKVQLALACEARRQLEEAGKSRTEATVVSVAAQMEAFTRDYDEPGFKSYVAWGERRWRDHSYDDSHIVAAPTP